MIGDATLEVLVGLAAHWTGFSLDAIRPDAVRRAAAALLAAPKGAGQAAGQGTDQTFDQSAVAGLLQRGARGDPAVIHALCQAVSVGETYFFRQPEHFRWIAGTFVPRLLASGRASVRAWSAGCATGEEAYSLAACLLDSVPAQAPGLGHGAAAEVAVLGTDLLERNLASARAASYGSWSRRPSGPLLHPLFREPAPRPSDRAQIAERVAAAVTFREHNLLDAPPEVGFDLILCRNVLVYFSPAAVRTVVAHLTAALAPGGALLFGTMDVNEPMSGLLFEELREHRVYQRAPPEERAAPQAAEAEPAGRNEPAARPELSTAPLPKAPLPPLPPLLPLPVASPPEPVALHLKALVHIDRGEQSVATRELAALNAQVPDYVPGLLERALCHQRAGERSAAKALMREVLRRTARLPLEELLPGPEPLPVSFYRDAAETYLRSGMVPGRGA